MSEVWQQLHVCGWASSCGEVAGFCARRIPVPSAASSKSRTSQGKPSAAASSLVGVSPEAGNGMLWPSRAPRHCTSPVPTEHTVGTSHLGAADGAAVLAGASHTSACDRGAAGRTSAAIQFTHFRPSLCHWSGSSTLVLTPERCSALSQCSASSALDEHSLHVGTSCLTSHFLKPQCSEGWEPQDTDTKDSRPGSIKQSLGCAQTRATDTVKASLCSEDQTPSFQTLTKDRVFYWSQFLLNTFCPLLGMIWLKYDWIILTRQCHSMWPGILGLGFLWFSVMKLKSLPTAPDSSKLLLGNYISFN